MKRSLLPIVLLTSFIAGGCDEAPAESPPETAVESTAAAPQPAAEEASSAAAANEADTPFDGLRAAYAALSDALASDDADSTQQAAATLADLAGAMVAGSDQAENLTALHDASMMMTGDDLEALRASFQKVSEAYVGLARLSPQLLEGQHLYHCPMVDGYGYWMQSDDELRNPYMGSRMLHCGEEREM